MVVSASQIVGAGGSAYVFVQSGSDWIEQAKLEASDAEEGDAFGTSVSISVSRISQSYVTPLMKIVGL